MNRSPFLQSAMLLSTVFVSFILSQWIGALYQAEILAIAFVVYMIVRKYRWKSQQTNLQEQHMLDAHILTLVLLTIVFTTGGLGSPYFFLMYFLMFGLALLVHPALSASATCAIVALCIPGLMEKFEPIHVASLLSLPLMVPFALLIGSSYRSRIELEQKLMESKNEVASVETDALLFISTVVRTHVDTMIEHAQGYSSDPHLAEIRATARRLQRLIDKFVRSYT